ncbi:cortical protein marker for cell polarity-domain-containing protein [Mycotypha africana]|uniref:cortical protein marker for cell polarity-domain-containing protein n=1 Tax=Mycotypha africana TaxID=64632 RepID=UPI0023006B91|nr:cortical protein marker for cell polarity-domain-containing protein [Mycotypha africana]KAI8979857.1 cortical protein marker for cell polarity-domain-containing protein [Mycotypha africana]
MVSRKLWYLIYYKCFVFLIAILHFDNVNAGLPKIELESVGGGIGVIGNFVGLSPILLDTIPYQFGLLPNDTSNHHIIVSQKDNDNLTIYKSLATIEGSITTYCKLSDNQYILAGDFQQINNSNFNHIAQFDSQTYQFIPLQQGLDGPVRALYCDNSTRTIYVGGDFTSPLASSNNFTGHVASFKDNQWVPLPWKGFNGPVSTIIKTKNLLSTADAIIFGGQFNSTGDGQYVDQVSNNLIQPINLQSATISEGNGQQFGNHTNPSSVVCSQSPWLLQNGVPGYWQAQFIFPIRPTLFRITNAHTVDGRNTNAFNIISLGSNEYFQLSYRDPATNQPMTCSEQCYLSNDSTIPYQDFTVLQPITTNGIRINIDSWYGESGGLGGVSVYNSDATLQPTNSDNMSSGNLCAASVPSTSSTPSSTVLTTGNWTQRYSYDSYQTYLISTINSTDLGNSDISVIYKPYIAAQGYYDVYATTPGCVGTSTCDQRTQMQLTLDLTPGNTSTVILDQNIVSDERILIYSGPISSSISSSFRPTITMNVSPNATETTSTNTVTIFGSAIAFMRNSTLSSLSSILVYFPQNDTWTPLPHQLIPGSEVNTIQTNDAGTLYIGGKLQSNITSSNNNSSSSYNIAIYNDERGFLPIADNGLNGAIFTSILAGSSLLVGGSFNNSIVPQQESSLNHLALYDLQTETWTGLERGVNGIVENLYTTSDGNIHISGSFNSTIATTQSRRLYNNAEYDIYQHRFIVPRTFIDGIIANQINLSPNTTLYLGLIKDAQTYYADNLAFVPNTLDSQQEKPAAVVPSFATPITQLDPNAVITAAAYYTHNNSAMAADNNKSSFLIIAGSFYINNTLCNVAMYDPQQNTWNQPCILQNMQNSSINKLFIVKDYLFIGGHFSHTTVLNITDNNNGSNNVASTATSIALYNLQTQSLEGITGVFMDGQQQQPGTVNVIYSQDDGKKIYIGGQFAYAGLLNCNAVCLFSMETRQWTQAVSTGQLSGTVNDMFIDSQGMMTVVGDLVTVDNIGQAKIPIARFDTSASSFSNNGIRHAKRATAPHPLINGLEDPFVPTSLLYDLDANFIIAGKQQKDENNSSYSIKMWNGQQWSPMNTNLGPSSIIHQLLWMPIDPSSAKYLPRYPADSDSMLMAVGQLELPQGSKASAALYDGSQWHPYFLTDHGSHIVRVFTALPCCTTALATHHYLSVPAVILISIAISLGILFCLTGLVFLYLFYNHRHHPAFYKYDMLDAYAAGAGTTAAGATAAGMDSTTSKKYWKPKHRPTSLLAMIDAAALAANATGGVGAVGQQQQEQQQKVPPESPILGYSSAVSNRNNALANQQQYGRDSVDISDGMIATAAAATSGTTRFRNSSQNGGVANMSSQPFSALMMAALKNGTTENNNGDTTQPPISESSPRVFYAKFPFEAKEFGELAFDAHTPIVVTDTTDNVWWMGYKDDGSGNAISGLFPSNYVTKNKPTFQIA